VSTEVDVGPDAANAVAIQFSVKPRIVTLIASGAVLLPLQRRIIASSQQHPEVIEAMRRDGSADISGAALAAASLTLAASVAAV
jgi:hypothetical protein